MMCWLCTVAAEAKPGGCPAVDSQDSGLWHTPVKDTVAPDEPTWFC